MPTNVEIKARVDDLDAMRRRAAALADDGPHELVQDDTFFRCADGRLKLRVFPDGLGELIFYRRADAHGPRVCDYRIARTPDPEALRASLAAAWGEAGRVHKRRTLYRAGRTRIHLDRVEGLGDFLELEVVLADGEPVERGREEAHRLMTALGVDPERCVDVAYVDLLSRRGAASGERPAVAASGERPAVAASGPALATVTLRSGASVAVRPFAREDTEAVIALWQRCGLTRPWNDPTRDIERKLGVQPHLFVVAHDAHRVVGAVMAGYDGHRGWVNYLAVCPSLRGQGLGAALMRHVEQGLRALGCPKVNLQIRTGNAAVRAFYESLGYAVDDAFSMGRRLIPDVPQSPAG